MIRALAPSRPPHPRLPARPSRLSPLAVLLPALFLFMGLSGEAEAQQEADPRIGVWQNVANPGNVMNYEALPGGGTRLVVESVNEAGEVTSWWGYDAFFDGSWHPVVGTGRSGEEEDATVTRLNAVTTEIRYRRPAGGSLDRTLENVVSRDGESLWVIFRDAEGIVSTVATYRRVR
jgi:hypothetical protein